MSFKFDFERLLNDWILLACLIGNDFIPNIPFIYIRTGGLFLLWDIYKKTLPKLKGILSKKWCLLKLDYITCDDKLNIDEFKDFLSALSFYEQIHIKKACFLNEDKNYSTLISLLYKTEDVI